MEKERRNIIITAARPFPPCSPPHSTVPTVNLSKTDSNFFDTFLLLFSTTFSIFSSTLSSVPCLLSSTLNSTNSQLLQTNQRLLVFPRAGSISPLEQFHFSYYSETERALLNLFYPQVAMFFLSESSFSYVKYPAICLISEKVIQSL